MAAENKKPKFRIGILLILSLLVLGVTFAAYMLNTSLEKTLEEERGESLIIHDYAYSSSAEQQENSQ
ncbi:MAG: hypothetical protein IJ561_08390 [Ruminococcus sp.]|nr:hypothetical protein [Ruminococcus sp.]